MVIVVKDAMKIEIKMEILTVQRRMTGTQVFSHVFKESGIGYVPMHSLLVLNLKFHVLMEAIAQKKDYVVHYKVRHAWTQYSISTCIRPFLLLVRSQFHKLFNLCHNKIDSTKLEETLLY